MDILHYLKSFDITIKDEEQFNKFLDLKKEKIKECIFDLYGEFIRNNPGETPVKNSDSFAVEEIAISEKESENDIINPSTNSISSDNLDPPIRNESESMIEPQTLTGNEDANKVALPAGNLVTNNPEPVNADLSISNTSNDAISLLIKNKSIILPNGKVNQDYSFLFNVKELGIDDIAEYWFEGIDNIGLKYNLETKELSGIPSLAGDHKIKLRIKRKDWSEGKPIFEREIILIINPDPKSLWKNIPTPTDVEYYKPDCDKQFVKVEAISNVLGLNRSARKDIVVASQRGRSHAQEGKPRDDDFAVNYLKEHDWYVLVVADGAGSAKYSRKGSEIACKTVLEVCDSLIKSNHKEFEHLIKEFSLVKSEENRKKMGDSFYSILGNAVFKSLKNIELEAKKANKPTKEFATTLIVAICKKFKFGWFVGAFWVGDGGLGIYNKETRFLKILGESDGGEFAGQTRFLTMPEITQPSELYRRLRFDIVDDFTALLLMTDGVTDPKFETDANLFKVEKWDELWSDLSKEVDFSDNNEGSADQLLKWLDFWSPGNHDDRTIAILF